MDVYSKKQLPPANPNNERGKSTWEWHVPEDHQVTAYRRPAGTKFGGHFHKGEDPSKNPELFLLLSGKIRVEFLTMDGQTSTVELDAQNGPVELKIFPNILHRMQALTECLFIEYRVTPFNQSKPDLFEPKDFPFPNDWLNP